MRWLTTVAITVTLLVGAIGCDNPVTPKVKSFTYPLGMGNQWVYDFQTIRDFHGKKPNDTVTFSITVEVVKVDTILPGIFSYTMHTTSSPPEGSDPRLEKRYLNLPGGLYLMPSDPGASMALPKRSGAGPSVTFQGHQYENIQTLLSTLIGPPGQGPGGESSQADSLSLLLPYPQTLGQRWTCTQIGDDHPYGVDMLIAGGETVKNAAGSFECHVIHWIYDPPIDDLDVMDFTSAEGLVQRRIEARNLSIDEYEHFGVDTADVVSTYELTSFHLY